jgi:hypothetical protein
MSIDIIMITTASALGIIVITTITMHITISIIDLMATIITKNITGSLTKGKGLIIGAMTEVTSAIVTTDIN